MPRYLITGGAGFIGSSIAHALVAQGERPRIIDNFVTGRRENLEGIEHSVDLIEGDINDACTVRDVCRGAEFVFHEAALPSVPRSIADPIASNEANVTGTLRLLIGARDAGVRRVVYAGSSSAYGDTPTLPKVEDMATGPLSPYAVSKLAGEMYCRVFARHMGIEAVVLRYFNVFGPRQNPDSEYAAVIPRFIRAIMRNEPATIFGDGTQTRDFTFIENVVDANLRACVATGASGRVFNVACGAKVSLLELHAALVEIMGSAAAPTFRPGRRGDVAHSLADITAAKDILGYRPRVALREGLERTVEWFQTSARAQ